MRGRQPSRRVRADVGTHAESARRARARVRTSEPRSPAESAWVAAATWAALGGRQKRGCDASVLFRGGLN